MKEEEEIVVEATQRELVKLFAKVGSPYEPFGSGSGDSDYLRGYMDFIVRIVVREGEVNEIVFYDENGWRWDTIKDDEWYFDDVKDDVKKVKELMKRRIYV